MAIQVIREGNYEPVTHEVDCPKCNSGLRFIEDDVKVREYEIQKMGYIERTLNCPVCKTTIELNPDFTRRF